MVDRGENIPVVGYIYKYTDVILSHLVGREMGQYDFLINNFVQKPRKAKTPVTQSNTNPGFVVLLQRCCVAIAD